MNSDSLRFILGLKLKQQRIQKSLSLKEVAAQTGLSISYLSEIEKGKKYPKPEKLLHLAQVLEIPFDSLVSTQLSDTLDPLRSFLNSEAIQAFPFQLFGISGQDLLDLATNQPDRASALIRTLAEIAGEYDMQVEQFLHAALRSYQTMQGNYFVELEETAKRFRTETGWQLDYDLEGKKLLQLIEQRFHIPIDLHALGQNPQLKECRSVYVEGPSPKLLINSKLRDSQRIFILLRELGYHYLGLEERPLVSGAGFMKLHSFESLMNYFKASYFAGAVMLDADFITQELRKLFQSSKWDAQRFMQLKNRPAVTPELWLYRLSQLLPGRFNLGQLYYQRFHHEIGSNQFLLTKWLNLSPVFMYHGKGLNEHYCRRWTPISQLRALAQFPPTTPQSETVSIRRLRFLDAGAEFLTISISRRLQLKENTLSSISLGLLLDDTLKSVIQFWNDPAIPIVQVNETCERCSLSHLSCTDRAAPARIYQQNVQQKKQSQALEELLAQLRLQEELV